MLNIILLSGGSGTRLWPLSNEARSKQFLKVLPAAPSNQAQDAAAPDKSQEKRESMVQRTIRQIRTAIPSAHIIIATAKAQESALRAQIEGDFDVIC